MRYNIILPKDYEETGKRYPTLYLLHGIFGNYAAWAEGAKIHAPAHDLIVVMPDAGNSWYVNWAGSAEGQKVNWDDYITKDLVDHIDATYRTIAQREGRAINGASMGGYGALTLGLCHPDLFCSIGSHSGVLGFARSQGEDLSLPADERERRAKAWLAANRRNGPLYLPEGFRSLAERTPKGAIFRKVEDANAYDPFQLAPKVPKEKLPHIYLDCGTEDGLIAGAQEFMKLLMDNEIPFTYAQSPGGHHKFYWARELGHSMSVQHEIIQRNLRLLEN
jgi:S-formylglutathione hydrolase FrmB